MERVSWRLEISHRTRYCYDRPVVASYNEARVTPLSTGTQLVLGTRVAVEPRAAIFSYRDYWGAVVHAFDLHTPHQTLVVTSTALVDTAVGTAGPGGASWGDLARGEVLDGFYELLAPCALVNPVDLGYIAAELRSGCASPDDAVHAAVRWSHDQLEYGAGSTHVATSASAAWKAGRGVCQDFAHLSLAVLRAMGVPGRYVSGYFYPQATAPIGTKVLGESHAWVEAWTGSWTSHDPTNLVSVGERHVVVAAGRDYNDVSPMRGIYSGPPGSSTEVTVELTRRG